MALSEDQRALLRLLLAGDTYEQVAGVLGTDPDEVRHTAHRAVEALDRAPDREFPQDAVRARLEALEGNPGAGAVPAPIPPAQSGRGRAWLLWLAAGAVAIAAIVVVVVASGGGGGGGASQSTTSGAQEDVVPVRLTPVGGSKASGMISVVRVAEITPWTTLCRNATNLALAASIAS